jgi:hypothetical protein
MKQIIVILLLLLCFCSKKNPVYDTQKDTTDVISEKELTNLNAYFDSLLIADTTNKDTIITFVLKEE